MKWDTQKQESGDNSTNIQSGGNTYVTNIQNGITEKRVFEIIDEKLMEYVHQLGEEARRTALERGHEFAENLIQHLKEKGANFDAFREPAVQLAAIDGQKAYSETGNAEGAEITIEMLADFVNDQPGTPRANIYKLAMKAVSSLSQKQINALTIMFYLNRVSLKAEAYPEDLVFLTEGALLYSGYSNCLNKFLSNASTSKVELEMLAVFNCVTSAFIQQDMLQKWFTTNVSSHVMNPLSMQEKEALLKEGAPEILFGKSSWNSESFTFSHPVRNPDFKFAPDQQPSPETMQKIIARSKQRLNDNNLKKGLMSIHGIKAIYEYTKIEFISTHFISPVGVAIAISNAKRAGQQLDEKVWFPDA